MFLTPFHDALEFAEAAEASEASDGLNERLYIMITEEKELLSLHDINC